MLDSSHFSNLFLFNLAFQFKKYLIMKSKLLKQVPQSYVIFMSFLTVLFILFIGQNTVLAQNQNSIVNGGYISTSDNTSICIDSESDIVNVTVEGNSGRVSQWVITDDSNNILALPEAPPFDFNGAGEGVCRIWHLSYNGIPPFNRIDNLSDLRGRFDLSNYIEVVRTMAPEGGDLAIAGSGDTEIEICAGDGVSDAFDVTLEGASGDNSLWVITDETLNILATPPSAPFDLEGAGEGVCLIWHLSYADSVDLTGVTNAGDLMGCYDLSNPITVTRNGVNGGDLAIAGSGDTAIEIIAGDGVSDAFDVTLEGAMGDNSLWVITDEALNILATPPSAPFDLEGAGEGVCLIWHLSYADSVDLTGVTNAGDLMGCLSLSNPITVTRIAASNRISLFPNPAISNTRIQLPKSTQDSYTISVYDLYNTRLMSKNVNSNTLNGDSINLSLNSLKTGTYLVKIINETTGEQTIKKLVKKN